MPGDTYWKQCRRPEEWVCDWCCDDWYNEHDGSRKFHIGRTPDRVICDTCLSHMRDLLTYLDQR